jgi:hypothetical protein
MKMSTLMNEIKISHARSLSDREAKMYGGDGIIVTCGHGDYVKIGAQWRSEGGSALQADLAARLEAGLASFGAPAPAPVPTPDKTTEQVAADAKRLAQMRRNNDRIDGRRE